LTKEGIELREIGFFTWDMIESFSTLVYMGSDNNDIYLVLHFREYADLKFEISSLEKNKDELVSLILKYKGNKNLVFAGHKKK
jgi:hypothetical protein